MADKKPTPESAARRALAMKEIEDARRASRLHLDEFKEIELDPVTDELIEIKMRNPELKKLGRSKWIEFLANPEKRNAFQGGPEFNEALRLFAEKEKALRNYRAMQADATRRIVDLEEKWASPSTEKEGYAAKTRKAAREGAAARALGVERSPEPTRKAVAIYERIMSRPGAGEGSPSTAYLLDRALFDETLPVETRNALSDLLYDEYGRGLGKGPKEFTTDVEPPKYRAYQRALAMDPDLVNSPDFKAAMMEGDNLMSQAGALHEAGSKKLQEAHKLAMADPEYKKKFSTMTFGDESSIPTMPPEAKKLYEEGRALQQKGLDIQVKVVGEGGTGSEAIESTRRSVYERANVRKASELQREIYEQERRLSDLNPNSKSGREAKARIKTAKKALGAMGRLLGTAAGVYEANLLGEAIGEEGALKGTGKYLAEGIEGTGELAQLPEMGLEYLDEEAEEAGLPSPPLMDAAKTVSKGASKAGEGLEWAGDKMLKGLGVREPGKGSRGLGSSLTQEKLDGIEELELLYPEYDDEPEVPINVAEDRNGAIREASRRALRKGQNL